MARVLAASLCGVTLLCAAATGPAKAPAWTLQSPGGETVSWPAAAQGEPTVLLFWPSWCPFSRALQPYVQDIWEDYRNAGVHVWTINIKEDGDPVQAMRDRGLSFPLLLDGDALMGPYGIVRTPWFIVIDGAGNIVYTRPADAPTPIDVAKAAREALNRLLGARAVALPSHYPAPYDLHLRKPRPSRLASDAVPDGEWFPWAGQYLSHLSAGEQLEDRPARGAISNGKDAIRVAREIWSETYGAEQTREQAPYRAFRQGNLWVIAGRAVSGELGRGYILVIDADSGRLRRLQPASAGE